LSNELGFTTSEKLVGCAMLNKVHKKLPRLSLKGKKSLNEKEYEVKTVPIIG
jgi:hypothetical protein